MNEYIGLHRQGSRRPAQRSDSTRRLDGLTSRVKVFPETSYAAGARHRAFQMVEGGAALLLSGLHVDFKTFVG